jgi:hypothetical protein
MGSLLLSLCCVYLKAGIIKAEQTSIARQRLSKHVPTATNTVGRGSFYAVRVVSNVQYVVKEKYVISSSHNFLFLRFSCSYVKLMIIRYMQWAKISEKTEKGQTRSLVTERA